MRASNTMFNNCFDRKLVLSSKSNFYSSFDRTLETLKMDNGCCLELYCAWINFN